MKCDYIIKKLEQIFPTSAAESWDNVGFLLGRREKEITTIFIALDATDEVIDEAIESGADMILTHHPLVFSPLQRVNTDDFISSRVVRILQNDICYYAMHTNFDVLAMAEAAAEELGLEETQILSKTTVVKRSDGEELEAGIGKTGRIHQVMSLREYAEYVKEVFRLEYVNVYGDLEMPVEVVAICPGSGKSVIHDVEEKKVDVFVTGDVDHHMGIDFCAQGIGVIDAGHYGIEKIFVPYMKDYIKQEEPSIQILMAEEKNPFYTI